MFSYLTVLQSTSTCTVRPSRRDSGVVVLLLVVLAAAPTTQSQLRARPSLPLTGILNFLKARDQYLIKWNFFFSLSQPNLLFLFATESLSGLPPQPWSVSSRSEMSPKDREWYLLNAADIRSGGDAPAGSTAGCQLMGLDVWVRLQDCPDFDDVWGQSERPCVQETSGECHCCMALLVRGHSSVRHQCRVKHPWYMARSFHF